MLKRTLALLLALVLVAGMLPTPAFAAEEAPTAKTESTPVDLSALGAAIEGSCELLDGAYTPESLAALESALEEAQAVYYKETATQEEADAALTGLLDAVDALEAVEEKTTQDHQPSGDGEISGTDTTDLMAAITEAVALSEADYTPESWADLMDALAEASAVPEDADQNTVDAAWEKLMDALVAMERVKPDAKALEAAISKADALVESTYTPESYAAVQKASAAAFELLMKETFTQAEADAALTALNTALDALVAVEGGLNTLALDLISTKEELDAFLVDGKYVLTQDITLADTWTPIDLDCVFDGQGHTVTIQDTRIFNDIQPSGLVQNLVIVGSAKWNVDVAPVAKNNNGTIRNCINTAAVEFTESGGKASGLVHVNQGTGTITNCLFSGSMNGVGKYQYGLVGNNAGTLSNCYYVNGSKGANGGSGTVVNCSQVTAADIATPEFIEKLNANADPDQGDLVWSLNEDGVPVPGGAGDTESVDKTALTALISEADGLKAADYTADSWAAFQAALTEAKKIQADESATAEDVDAATEALAMAINALEHPAQEKLISTKEELDAFLVDGKYVLTQDIVLADTWTPIDLDCVFDGQGHTVTLHNTRLFNIITETGLVQNLVIDGSAEAAADVAPLAKENKGTVRNCISTVECGATESMGKACGLVHTNQASGKIENCLTTKTYTYPAGKKDYTYGLVNTNAGIVSNSYYVNVNERLGEGKDACGGSGTVTNCERVALADLSTAEFLAKLNANADTANGDLPWGLNGDGVPVPGGTGTGGSGDTEIVDKTDLNELITEADGLSEADYTADSWAAFQTALLEAKRVQSDENATAEDVETATDALALAILALVEATDSVDKAELQAKVDSVNGLTGEPYSPESWAAFQNALAAAKKILSSSEATQEQVNAALENLTNALAALAPAVISITNILQLENLGAGKYYRLDADLVLPAAWSPSLGQVMNAVLDGNGHTITLSNTGWPLFFEIGPKGQVYDLGIRGSLFSMGGYLGAIATRSAGRIFNCWSLTTVTGIGNNAGGLVGLLKNGGSIENCVVGANVYTTTDQYKTGGMAGEAQSGTSVTNCYWLNTAAKAAVGEDGGAAVTGGAPKTRTEMYSAGLISLLNGGRGEGLQWAVSNEGYPYFGANVDYVPPEEVKHPIIFTPLKVGAEAVEFNSIDGITLSKLDATDWTGFIGHFKSGDGRNLFYSVDGYQYSGKDPLFVGEDNDVYAENEGTATVSAYTSCIGGKYSGKVYSFTVTVTNLGEGQEIEALRLAWGNKTAGDGETMEVAGSTVFKLNPQVKLVGKDTWQNVPSGYFTFTTNELDDKPSNLYLESNGNCRAKAPGTGSVTVSGMGKTVTISILSDYIPVTSIKPANAGTYTVHERNPNSAVNFVDLKLANDLFNNVVVNPYNASYAYDWNITSSNPDVAEYYRDWLDAVLPKAEGTTTLTAICNDPQLKVSGSTEVTIQYFNPVTEVKMKDDGPVIVESGKTTALPILLTGPKSADGYHVTEAGMKWSYDSSDGGEAEVFRDSNVVELQTQKEYCISNDAYKVRGKNPGVVNVTGTPVDSNNGAKPVTFTVVVLSGEEEKPVDTDKLVNEGIPAAQNWILNQHVEPKYGSEWDLFSLDRSGKAVSEADIAAYVESIKAQYAKLNSSKTKPTTLARVVLTLTQLGVDATDVGGLNFIDMLCNSDAIMNGSNEPAWALIALDSANYAVPAGAKWDRDSLIDAVLTFQGANGGFGLTSSEDTSLDMTGMCIQALAPYYVRDKVTKSVYNALRYLQGRLDYYCDFGSVESTAQLLVALTALGKDPLDPNQEINFVKGPARNLITALTAYQNPETGAFRYQGVDTAISTQQGLYALEAYRRFKNGENCLYDLTDRLTQPVKPEAVTAVEDLIEKIGTPVTLGSKDAIDAARKAYDALTDDQKSAVGNYETLTVAEKAYSDLLASAAVTAVEDLIKKIGTPVTLESKDAIDAAREAYDALTDDQKSAVSNYETLTAAEKAYNDLLKPAADITVTFRLVGDTLHGGDPHTGYVTWIPTVSMTVKKDAKVFDVFDAALKANAMTYDETQHGYIGGIQAPAVLGGYDLYEFDNGKNSGWEYTVNGTHPSVGLRDCVLKDGDEIVWHYVDDYTNDDGSWLDAPDTAPVVTAVEELIKKIGTPVTLESKDAIDAARKAYDALPDDQKSAVSNYETLTAAEKAYNDLQKPAANEQLYEAYKKTYSHLRGMTPETGSVGGEWLVLGLARSAFSGLSEDDIDAYYAKAEQFVTDKIDENERLNATKSTDNARLILALTAIGRDPTKVAGHDLTAGLNDMTYIKKQGINGPIWALIALASHDYEPAHPISYSGLINEILAKQDDNGAFGNTDITAMAVTALAPYYGEDPAVKAAVDKTLSYLSSLQSSTGGFPYGTQGESVESCAQVIVALSALGIDAASDARFVRNGNSIIDAFLSYYDGEGAFYHNQDHSGNAQMSTEQAFYAMAAYFRNQNEEDRLFDMTDVTLASGGEDKPETVDKSALKNSIAKAEKLNEADYTESSWTYLETKLNAAKTIYNDSKANQSQVNNAQTNLENAIKSLKPDKTALNAAISKADGLKESDYTAKSWGEIKGSLPSALAAAKKVRDNTLATLDDVNAATKALEGIFAKLVKQGSGTSSGTSTGTGSTNKTTTSSGTTTARSKLEAEVKKAEELKKEDYTADSWKTFETALKNAQDTLNNSQATQTQLTNAYTKLVAAEKTLKKVGETLEESRKKLEAQVAQGEKLAQADYTPETWKPFADALANAKKILASENPTAKQLDDAYNTLVNAETSLEKAVDYRSMLESLVEKCGDLAEENYTPESWAKYAEALNKAKEALADENTDQQTMKQLLDNLSEAGRSLVPAADRGGISLLWWILMLVLLILLGGGCALTLLKRKKK